MDYVKVPQLINPRRLRGRHLCCRRFGDDGDRMRGAGGVE